MPKKMGISLQHLQIVGSSQNDSGSKIGAGGDSGAGIHNTMKVEMKILEGGKVFVTLIWCNIVLLIGHIVVETNFRNVNWLQVGHRHPLAAAYVTLEGLLSAIVGLAIFEMYYPSMSKTLTSNEARYYSITLISQILVWCLY
jgi:hypothetical protein